MAATSINITSPCSIWVAHNLYVSRTGGLTKIGRLARGLTAWLETHTFVQVLDGNPRQHVVRERVVFEDKVRIVGGREW